MKQKRMRRAFTLVELMVVLAILVLLVAMVGPRLLGTQKKADLKAAKQQISNLESCLNLYAVDNRTFPSTEQGLAALLEAPTASAARRGAATTTTTTTNTTTSDLAGTEPPGGATGQGNWDGPYMEAEALPVDPWNNPYQYEFPPTKGKRKDFPNIWSLGPDGEDNTDDDITNWIGGSDAQMEDGAAVEEVMPDEQL